MASPAGPLWALRPPIRLEGSDPVLAAIPAVGQDTDAILAASGYTAADIAELRRKGII